MEKNQKINHADGIELYLYEDCDGNFNYSEYVQTQISGNINKLHQIWADEGYIHFLSEWIKNNLPFHEKAICHGTRNGAEMKYFKKYLNVDIIGTEISPTAKHFQHTIQWDFHDIKEEWIENFDFIYSNSFDHSYNPEYCIKQWMRTLKKTGACIIEHNTTAAKLKASKLDPVGGSLQAMYDMINAVGKGYFQVDEAFLPKKDENAPYKGSTWGLTDVAYLIVKHCA